MTKKSKLAAGIKRYLLKRKWNKLDRWCEDCRRFLIASDVARADLDKIFDELVVHPILVGSMCAREFGENILTDDYDFLFSREDYEKILKEGFRYGINVKFDKFKFQGWNVDILKEGDIGTNGAVPNPKVIEGKSGFCSIEGLVYLKIIAMRKKDIEHIARLIDRMDENKLKAIIDSQNNEKAWNVYQQLKKRWEILN